MFLTYVVELRELTERASKELESVMPPVAKLLSIRNPLLRCLRRMESYLVIGGRWNELQELVKSGEKDAFGNLLAKCCSG